MALSCKVGSFACPTSTNASYGVTGVGFQPKAVFLFWNTLTANGSNVNATDQGYGFAVSTSQRAAVVLTDNYSGSGTFHRHINTKCVTFVSSAGTTIMEADLVSLDSDGMTFNFGTVSGTASLVQYLALGGADLTNAAIKEFQGPTTTGTQAYTGVGFQPDAALFISSGIVATPAGLTVGGSGVPHAELYQSIGLATSSTRRGTSAVGIASTENSAPFGDYQRTATAFALADGAVRQEADLVTFDSDGFTLNWTTVGAIVQQAYVWALCLKGGRYFVGSDTQKTSSGTKATTGVGFQPTGLLVSSINRVAATTPFASGDVSNAVGAASSPSARGCIWYQDGAATCTNSNLDLTKVLRSLTDANPTPTLNAEADLTAFDADGFTLNWSTADATAREFLFLAVGSTVSAGVDLSVFAGEPPCDHRVLV